MTHNVLEDLKAIEAKHNAEQKQAGEYQEREPSFPRLPTFDEFISSSPLDNFVSNDELKS